ncbi:MAG TPA: UTP--glucose-1-phosphate uridylyltransferase, partial [Aeromicrobium sp.]|nr:UTP--glucose-1-phosphate uridylyltransferase [Aeromicrobium sp.]
MSGLEQARARMLDAGVHPKAIDVFAAFYAQLAEGATGMMREADVEPLDGLPHASMVSVTDQQVREAAATTVVIKLNGGLGTSMGLDQAKSLLQVRPGMTFLDIIVQQVRAVRASLGVELPVLFMNSFRTRDDTLAALATYSDLAVGDLPL